MNRRGFISALLAAPLALSTGGRFDINTQGVQRIPAVGLYAYVPLRFTASVDKHGQWWQTASPAQRPRYFRDGQRLSVEQFAAALEDRKSR